MLKLSADELLCIICVCVCACVQMCGGAREVQRTPFSLTEYLQLSLEEVTLIQLVSLSKHYITHEPSPASR